jgi:plasmid stability protein
MAQLVVRRLDEETVQRLRERAAKAGVSMEEEHRRILKAAVADVRKAMTFKEHLLSIPTGDDLEITPRTISKRKVTF